MTASPFVFDVADLLRAGSAARTETRSGPAPCRIGPEMIGIARGETVDVTAALTPLGEAVCVDATVTAQLTGQCVRCLAPIRCERSFTIREVFTLPGSITDATTNEVIAAEETEEDAAPAIVDERIDIEQNVLDTVGLELPFSPTCADFGGRCDTSVDAAPSPDGISGKDDRPDPRWAGLEKYK